MLTRIHVNQHIIKRNRKEGLNDPPLTVKDYKQNRKAQRVEILGPDGEVVATVVHSPDKPLSCGARVWIETESEVRTSD
jgi:hypothetical protein